jgi:hypothetical protein
VVPGSESWLERSRISQGWHQDRPHQRYAVSIFGSILIRAFSEKLNVQFIMAGRAAGECTEIL